jgi:hypothetical protein
MLELFYKCHHGRHTVESTDELSTLESLLTLSIWMSAKYHLSTTLCTSTTGLYHQDITSSESYPASSLLRVSGKPNGLVFNLFIFNTEENY